MKTISMCLKCKKTDQTTVVFVLLTVFFFTKFTTIYYCDLCFECWQLTAKNWAIFLSGIAFRLSFSPEALYRPSSPSRPFKEAFYRLEIVPGCCFNCQKSGPSFKLEDIHVCLNWHNSSMSLLLEGYFFETTYYYNYNFLQWNFSLFPYFLKRRKIFN